METQICEITGGILNVPIEYLLEGKSLGKTMVSESSMAQSRINAARKINIWKYDQFIIDGRMDSKDVTMPDGFPCNDFKIVEGYESSK